MLASTNNLDVSLNAITILELYSLRKCFTFNRLSGIKDKNKRDKVLKFLKKVGIDE